MNCKPGDLAIVISHAKNYGKLLRVIDGFNCLPGEWHCMTLQQFVGYEDGPERTIPAGSDIWGKDADLRPIRDPGDDAIDETLLWLPVPSNETEDA